MLNSRNQRLSLLFALIAIGGIIGVIDAKPPSRVSEGSDAAPGVFTYIVSIGVRNGYTPSHICGGAIISSRHVLTAGHCVGDKLASQLSVRAGITNLRDTNAVEARVRRIITNPDYLPQIREVGKEREVENDIAILVLDRELSLGGRLTKVSIPKTMPKNHQRATIAGWGNIRENPVRVPAQTLQTAQVEFLDDQACWESVLPQFFCGLQDRGNILSGDSGSPLVSRGEVIGVVSSGWGNSGIPDTYTNVYHYRDWINSVIN